jgi:hypothetical protein
MPPCFALLMFSMFCYAIMVFFNASLLCAFGVPWWFFVVLLVFFDASLSCAFGVLWWFFVVLLVFFDASLLCAFGAFRRLFAMCSYCSLMPPCCMLLLFFVNFLGLIVCFYICVHGWKHTRGGQKCCHIVYFFKDVHVWTSTMVILKHIFSKFLHNLVDYNTKKLIAKEIPFSNLYCEAPKYMRGKKMYATLY